MKQTTSKRICIFALSIFSDSVQGPAAWVWLGGYVMASYEMESSLDISLKCHVVCLSVLLLCYRITWLWFCNKTFCNKTFCNKTGTLFVKDSVFSYFLFIYFVTIDSEVTISCLLIDYHLFSSPECNICEQRRPLCFSAISSLPGTATVKSWTSNE